MAVLFTSLPNATPPSLDNQTSYGKGHWKIAAYDDTSSGTKVLTYSTDRKVWHTITAAASPVVLYSTNLYVDHIASDGCVVSLPPEILPQYARPREGAESKQEQIDANAPAVSQLDYYQDIGL